MEAFGEGVGVKLILERLRQGASLHRIASERRGYYWLLMPGEEPVADAVAEAVASNPCVVADGAPVGRLSWEFADRERVEARANEIASPETRAGLTVIPWG